MKSDQAFLSEARRSGYLRFQEPESVTELTDPADNLPESSLAKIALK